MSAELLNYAKADAIVASFAHELKSAHPAQERVALDDAAGRVLAEPIVADQDQPPFTRSTRDGFACRAAEVSAHQFLRIAGSTHAGDPPPAPLPAQTVWEIMTGAPVPEGADAVVMLEHAEHDPEHDTDRVRLLPDRRSKAGENIVDRGAQAHRGDTLLAPGGDIGPAQIALAAACGCAELAVYERPRVAILTTGDELVAIEREPAPGQIRNSNASMLAALVARAGGAPWVLPAAADSAESLDSALRLALDADMLVISGGVSAGKFDLVEPALARLGARFHFTGIRIQPGKPLVFGHVPREAGSALPFFGLPGNPISTAVTFQLFAAQILAALAGRNDFRPQFLAAELAHDTDRKSKPGLTRFLPALCEFQRNDRLPQVATIPWHGSGDLPAFARSNCVLVIPEDEGALEAGEYVRILMI
jgi:molybdopterin molybdotransferase